VTLKSVVFVIETFCFFLLTAETMAAAVGIFYSAQIWGVYNKML
jgi:hypothetical protein